MGSRSGFNPNQSRADDGKWKKERGQRPASGGLRKPPAGEADADQQVTAPDLPPSAWRGGDAPTGDLYYGYRNNRDAALDEAGQDGAGATSVIRADRAAAGMLETAPLRIGEVMREQHPDAQAVTFKNVGGTLKVTGFATDTAAPRPEIHRLVEEDRPAAEEINAITEGLTASGTKPSSFDMNGLRVDPSGNWYLPLDGTVGDGPGYARSSPEGVRIENAQLEYDAQRLENAADTIDRPEKPVSEITSQRELMWFVQNGTDDEVEQVAKSPHARAAVLHNIAMYGPEASQRSAIVNWQVSESTIRAVYDRTPKDRRSLYEAGLTSSGKAPADIAEASRRPATYAKKKAAEEARAGKAESKPAPKVEPRRTPPAPEPAHWMESYTPEQRAYLREHMPINFDELGSSGKDRWEEGILSGFDKQRGGR
ncbi:hypothetical protein [Microbacterium sp.]|uniref:hypothetical protein n=1 Tax=Microbacterium sp. TaxID=51671 RepID=UPI0026363642|nr:hypothetical protein [Microbacterium sp.]